MSAKGCGPAYRWALRVMTIRANGLERLRRRVARGISDRGEVGHDDGHENRPQSGTVWRCGSASPTRAPRCGRIECRDDSIDSVELRVSLKFSVERSRA